jgi:hypothetical protein
MVSASVPAAMLAGSAISGAAGIGGSLISGNAAKDAAKQQSQAALEAGQLQQKQFEQTRADLSPFMTAGSSILPDLLSYIRSINPMLGGAADLAQANLPGNMTQAELLQTPGYQFALNQGQRATQAAQAAKGLGMSGNAMKAGMNFATGLANQTYQDQFKIQQQRYMDYVQNFQNRVAQANAVASPMYNAAALGENAAARTGALGQQTYANIGNDLTLSGQALGTGTAVQGAAFGSGLNTLGNTVSSGLGNYAMSPYIVAALQNMGGMGSSNPLGPSLTPGMSTGGTGFGSVIGRY